MFSGLFNSRLKAAEKALSEGRFDEAYRLAIQPDLRDHRRGGAVLASLAEKFLERARKAYREDRFAEAMMDLDRAEAGGVLKEAIAELRGYVQTVATETARREDSRRDRIQAAVQRIEDGSLDAGRQILEKAATDDRAVQEVQRKLAERTHEVAAVIEQANRLVTGGQLAQAAERVRKAKSIDAHHPELARFESSLCERILGEARGALGEGKPARAADELNCLGDLGGKLPARKELTDLLAIAREAAALMTAHDYSEARRAMMTLAARLGETRWIKIALEHLRVLDETYATLSSGPLGDRFENPPVSLLGKGGRIARAPSLGSLDDTVALPAIGRIGDASLPDRVLLLVDGGGSYLILRSGTASVGRAAAEHPADIAVFSDVAERHANIQRVDDDYFVFGAKEIEVGGRTVQHQLLRDGDRLVLGKKAKFNFRVPSRKSPSAVLELSDTTKMPNDVRRVILFHQSATLGQGSTAHILCRHAALPLVLFERGGGLWIRQQNDGHADASAKPLRLGESVEIGGVTLTAQTWKAGGAVGTA